MKSYSNEARQHGLLTWFDQRIVFHSETQSKPYHNALAFSYLHQVMRASGLCMDPDRPVYETPLAYSHKINRDELTTWPNYISIDCENALVEKVNGISVNLYDMYRTRKEAIDMITKRVMQLVNAVRAVKAGKWRSFKKSLHLNKRLKKPRAFGASFSRTWLEHSYGWVPLLSDIYHIIDQTFEPPKIQAKARSKGQAESTKTGYSREPYFGYGTESVFAKYSNTMQVDITVDIPALQAASQYGVLNPLAVAWEAVPFSFVVDWFVPIGTYIEQLNNYAGLKFSNFYETRNVTVTRVLDVGVRFSEYGPLSSYKQGVSLWKSKHRFQIFRQPEFRLVPSEAPLTSSVHRSMNAIALFGALFLEKRK